MKPFTLIVALALSLPAWSAASADTLHIAGDGVQSLADFMEVAETTDGQASWSDMKARPALFGSPEKLAVQRPDNYFWLKISLVLEAGADPERMVIFSQLTFVDYYLCAGDSLLRSGQLGKFRARRDIRNAEGRFRFTLRLPPERPLTLWIRVHHTKKYVPRFDFETGAASFMEQRWSDRRQIGLLLVGAMAVLFLYALLSFLVTFFRPYAWLLLFTGGMGLYTVSMGGYFIDWFFPQAPETGWLFNIHFGHAGLAGMLLLILDFWQMKQKSVLLYRATHLLLALLLLVSLLSFCLNYYWSNYNLMNSINLVLCLPVIAFLLIIIALVWSRLDRSQLFLAYGILLFTIGGLVVTILAFHMKEGSIALLPYIYNSDTILVVLLFSTGLKEKLRMVEVDKKRAQMLAEKNERITVLFNEVNHRVKNNLQMLYSLADMQLPRVKDGLSRAFLEDNMARIRTMMVVNKQLFRSEEEGNTGVVRLTEELCSYVAGIYDPQGEVQLRINGDTGARLPSTHTLSFGLILTELLTNSYKHAFADSESPAIEITIVLDETHSRLHFAYADNGVGMAHDAGERHSMGMELLHDLAWQLQASMEMAGDNGFYCLLKIPLNGQTIPS